MRESSNNGCPCPDGNPEPTPEDIARNEYEDILEGLPTLFGTGRSCCFTDLPAELRNRIYAAITASAKARHENHSSGLLTETPVAIVHNDLRALLGVSRSVRSDIASFLWSQDGFGLDLSFMGDNDSGKRREHLSGKLGEWVEVWGALALPCLRHLHFYFDHAGVDLCIDAESPEGNYVSCLGSEDHTNTDDYLISDADNDFEILVLAVLMPDGQLKLTYDRIVWLDEVLRERSRIVNAPGMSPERKVELRKAMMSIDRFDSRFDALNKEQTRLAQESWDPQAMVDHSGFSLGRLFRRSISMKDRAYGKPSDEHGFWQTRAWI